VTRASRDFQVFAKPAGSRCNLGCHYCYYLEKEQLYHSGASSRMPDDVLEAFIVQHIEAWPDSVIRFSWHGGEPLVLGLDYFHKIVDLQRRHLPSGRRIVNGIQTNGTLLNDEWCQFLAAENFAVGISLDGPPDMHDLYRLTKDGKPTHEQVIRGYRLLLQYRIPCEILCVVNACNVQHPTQVYRFFKELQANYLTFLPLVEPQSDALGGVSNRTVPAEAWGNFLCAVFDEWVAQDIGRIRIQIFEEAARPALGQGHTLCIFKETCGGIPVIEHNGDFFSCDHFVDAAHRLGNIRTTPLVNLLESPAQKAFGQAKLDTLPRYCQTCSVRATCNGECPKNRFIETPDGEPGLNYLCAGYQKFFTHCEPFLAQVRALRHLQQNAPVTAVPAAPGGKVGRNDPCPCGSGRKFKACCMRR